MSTVTCCTFLSHGSAVRPAISSARSAVAVASLSSFQWKPRQLSLCCAISQKGDHNPKTDLHPFNIPAFILVHPVPPREERWQLGEDTDKVNLWFEVPGQSKENLAVEIDEDVLVIKKKSHVIGGDVGQQNTGGGVTDYGPQTRRSTTASASEASSKEAAQAAAEVIYARLLLPAVYSREGVEAELKSGVLRVSVAKIKEQARRKISVSIQVK